MAGDSTARGWRTRVTRKMIAAYTADGAWRGRTLAQCAAEQASLRPDAVGIIEGKARQSFQELVAQAAQLAGALAAAGLSAGDVVSFQLPNWTEAVVVNLAASMLGLVCNPIIPIYRDAEVRFILKDCRAKVFFIPREFRGFDYADMAKRLRPQLPDLERVVVLRGNAEGASSYRDYLRLRRAPQSPVINCDNSAADPNAVKLVMYTSGTTGAPKGVLHTHNTILSVLQTFCDRFALDTDDVMLMASPVTHITGYLFALELPFVTGLKAVLMDKWNAAEAVRLIDEHRVTASVGATPFLSELVREAKGLSSRLSSLRYFVCGGAAVPPDLIRLANQTFAHGVAFRAYGMTEAPMITLGVRGRERVEEAATTDGEQIGNYESRLVELETGLDAPPGSEGEILVRGPQVMVGYTQWEQTLEAFDGQGYFRTGDLGTVGADGFLTITGRVKDLIVRGGEKISAKELEDILHQHPAVRDVAVVAAPHARLGETVCAFVVPASGQTPSIDGLAEFLAAAGLARQKFPERLELVGELPRNASGKIQKNLLRDLIGTARHADPEKRSGSVPET